MSDLTHTDEFQRFIFRTQFNYDNLIKKYTKISENMKHSLELSVVDDKVYEVTKPGVKPRTKAQIQKELNKLQMNPNYICSSATTEEMTDSRAKTNVKKQNQKFETLYAKAKSNGNVTRFFNFDEDEHDDAHEFPPNSQVTTLDVLTQYEDDEEVSGEFDDFIDDSEMTNEQDDDDTNHSLEFPNSFAQNNNNEMTIDQELRGESRSSNVSFEIAPPTAAPTKSLTELDAEKSLLPIVSSAKNSQVQLPVIEAVTPESIPSSNLRRSTRCVRPMKRYSYHDIVKQESIMKKSMKKKQKRKSCV